MRYKIVHQTVYTYSSSVSVSHHLARLTPRELPRQQRFTHELTTEPNALIRTGWLDYFGNETAFLTVTGAHRSLNVKATSQVEVVAGPAPAPGPPWEIARDGLLSGAQPDNIDAQEFIFASHFIPSLPALAEYASASFAPGRPVLDVAVHLAARIHRDFKFDPRATTISTPLEQVLKHRRGVCQDFAHLQIGCLRAFGIPARYVSGYLETLPPPGTQKLVGADASHAWVEFFVPGVGWVDIDPTNNVLPSNRHIILAWGRDFDDVSPIRGVIVGGGKHHLAVAVDVTPLPQN
jgi:transglutaminase-like putative cysteine protease